VAFISGLVKCPESFPLLSFEAFRHLVSSDSEGLLSSTNEKIKVAFAIPDRATTGLSRRDFFLAVLHLSWNT